MFIAENWLLFPLVDLNFELYTVSSKSFSVLIKAYNLHMWLVVRHHQSYGVIYTFPIRHGDICGENANMVQILFSPNLEVPKNSKTIIICSGGYVMHLCKISKYKKDKFLLKQWNTIWALFQIEFVFFVSRKCDRVWSWNFAEMLNTCATTCSNFLKKKIETSKFGENRIFQISTIFAFSPNTPPFGTSKFYMEIPKLSVVIAHLMQKLSEFEL